MLTFKHFLDRPAWAAAAGYEFNLSDCLSYSAQKFGLADVLDLLEDTGEIELRQIFWKLPVNVLAMAVLLSWPLIFWIHSITVYFKCRFTKRNYAGSKRTERVEINLRNWISDFDRRQRRGRG